MYKVNQMQVGFFNEEFVIPLYTGKKRLAKKYLKKNSSKYTNLKLEMIKKPKIVKKIGKTTVWKYYLKLLESKDERKQTKLL